MNGIHDTSATEGFEGEGGFDPHAAARLLAHSRRRAQRELEFRSPWLSLAAAAVALVALGAIWLSVRGQHPYLGPTPAGLVVLYVLVAVRIGSVIFAHRRAQAGVSGRSTRQTRGEAAGLGVALVGVYGLMAALAVAGAGNGVVYGVYVVSATLIVMGAFWAGCSAVREDSYQLGLSIAVMLVAAGSAFAGPRGVWLSDGIGLCIVLLADTAVQSWRRRAAGSPT